MIKNRADRKLMAFCCTFMEEGVSGMDMGNQVPSAKGQMVGEGEGMVICLGGTGTPPPHP